MLMRYIKTAIFCAGLAFSEEAVLANGEVLVTAAEGTYKTKQLGMKIANGELVLEFEDSKKIVTLKAPDVADIRFDQAVKASSPTDSLQVEVEFQTGDILVGRLGPSQTADEIGGGIRIQSEILGELFLKWGQVTLVWFPANSSRPPAKPVKLNEDFVFTKGGDLGQGTLIQINENGIRYNSRLRKREVNVKPDDCAAVYLMPTQGQDPPAAPKTLYAAMQFADGSAFMGTIESLAGGLLRFKDLYGVERQVKSENLTAIHFKNNRIRYLSDMEVALAAENPDRIPRSDGLTDSPFPFQRDKNVTGLPGKEGGLSIRNEEFSKGLGVRARSALTFDLGGQYQKFEAVIGLDDCAGKYGTENCGNVVFKVLADGKEIFDSKPISIKDKPRPVILDVKGAKNMTLIVDFGPENGYGHQADWAKARIVKP